jgi:hypothetical protein
MTAAGGRRKMPPRPSWGTPRGGRRSPLQNRVTPEGEIVAEPARGLIMGNRGCLVEEPWQLGRARWRTKMWISCVLDLGGRKRDVMPEGRWTGLFFLDEATALSAGHRPCGYCRREDHVAFGEAWRAGHGLAKRISAAQMDVVLHGQRVEPGTRRKQTFKSELGALPAGVMVRYEEAPALVLPGGVRPWSFAGYGALVPVPEDTVVDVLTPPAMVAAVGAGYRPLVHPTAGETPLRSFGPEPLASTVRYVVS